MSKDKPLIDFTTIRRRERPYHTFEFEDSVAGCVTIQLRRILPTEQDAANDAADKLITKHVTGPWWNDKLEEWIKEPAPYYDAQGAPVVVTETCFYRASKIAAMQPAGGYSIDGVINLSVFAEDAWAALSAKADLVYRGVMDRKDDDPGNDSKALPAGQPQS